MSAKRPTMKQRAVIDKIFEYRGNVGKAMMEVGYSPNTAKNPSNLTNSQWFRKVLDSMDDSKYLNKLDEIAMNKDDKRASLQAISELLKLKNRYPKESIDIDLSLSRNRKEIIDPD
jgi:hypothetical protein